MKMIKIIKYWTFFILLVPILVFASNVTFEWDSNPKYEEVTHYNCYRSIDQINWVKANSKPILHTGTGIETWTDTGLSDGTYYWYGIAINIDSLESDPSNTISTTINTQPPSPPQNFIVSSIKKIIAWIVNLFKPFQLA